MIYCVNKNCPRKMDCLRFRAAPRPGEGRLWYKWLGCEEHIPDNRLGCEDDSCKLS
jgi:hypothetical protein